MPDDRKPSHRKTSKKTSSRKPSNVVDLAMARTRKRSSQLLQRLGSSLTQRALGRPALTASQRALAAKVGQMIFRDVRGIEGRYEVAVTLAELFRAIRDVDRGKNINWVWARMRRELGELGDIDA